MPFDGSLFRGKLAGSGQGVTLLVAGMAIHTAGGTIHLPMASQATLMISPFQAELIGVVTLAVAFFRLQITGRKRLLDVAIPAGDLGLHLSARVALGALAVLHRRPRGVVVTDGAIAGDIQVHRMIELDPVIELGQTVQRQGGGQFHPQPATGRPEVQEQTGHHAD